MHIILSQFTAGTFDPNPVVDLGRKTAKCRLNQEKGWRLDRYTLSSMYEIEEIKQYSDDDDDYDYETL